MSVASAVRAKEAEAQLPKLAGTALCSQGRFLPNRTKLQEDHNVLTDSLRENADATDQIGPGSKRLPREAQIVLLNYGLSKTAIS